ncbi:MAG: trypsin-like peptidase domain-containing protein [Candidatus Bathyarchaeota archaeon]|nr:trypsin-like peptidase domain-containing protein [Candidatus Bathyarchaeota archaeon]
MEDQKSLKQKFYVVFIATFVVISLFTGGIIGYLLKTAPDYTEKILSLEEQLATLNTQLSSLHNIVSALPTNALTTDSTSYQNLTESIAKLQSQLNNLQVQLSMIPTNALTTDSPIYRNLTESTAEFQSQLNNLQVQLSDLRSTTSPLNQNVTEIRNRVNNLGDMLSTLQTQLNSLQEAVNQLQQVPPTIYQTIYQNITYVTGDNTSLSQLFEQVKASVVVIQSRVQQRDVFGRTYYSTVQGSGFVYSHRGRMVVLTNNHVISGAISITVTFTTGDNYSATVLGTNPANDFAVLTTTAPQSIYKPLEIISSSTLKVGDPVIVVGTPYGLAGSMSEGIISALNRTITTSSQTIYNVIQTTAPLNPGNSGGPLMNYRGQVVGMATAIVEDSQGIGFAVPSDAFLVDIQNILG